MKKFKQFNEEENQEVEVYHQRRGQDSAEFHFHKKFKNLSAAKRHVKNVGNLPPDTIHYVITSEDGKTHWDTRKQGLI